MSNVLAGDLGGSGLRTALVDPGGRLVARHDIAFVAPLAVDGRAEADPEQWWTSFLAAADALALTAPEASRDVAAVAITGFTRTQVLLDRDQRVLRPAITWRDARASAIAAALAGAAPADHPERMHLNGFHPLARLAWVKAHEPETFARLAVVIEPKDFLSLRLTGVVAGDRISQARLAAARSRDHGGASLLQSAGIPETVVPPLLAPMDIIGRVRPGLAGALAGLAGIPVVTVAHDTWAAAIGLGAMRNGAAYNICGTTEVLGLVSDRTATADGLLTVDWGSGLMQCGGPSQTGADALTWLIELLGHGVASVDRTETIEALFAAPRDRQPIILLPYLQGERAPYWDARLRGALVGLERRHRAVDIAWAVMEGVAFLNRVVLERALAGTGLPRPTIRLGGGAAANRRWAQIKADVLDTPVLNTAAAEPGILGAAIVGFTAIGAQPSLATAQDALVGVTEVFQPREGAARTYDDLFELYRACESALRPISHALADWPHAATTDLS